MDKNQKKIVTELIIKLDDIHQKLEELSVEVVSDSESTIISMAAANVMDGTQKLRRSIKQK